MELDQTLGYSPRVQRHQPGIAKASFLPEEWAEGGLASTVVRSVLSDLDTLLAARGAGNTCATFVWGTRTKGGARLTCGWGPEDAQSLRIAWNDSEIRHIEIETRNAGSFSSLESPTDPAELMDWLVPRLWAHMQRGGALPAGIERFAHFF